MKRVALLLAPGFEEIEAVTPIDVLRRAEVEVTIAGLQDGPITGSHGITIQPDTTLDKVSPEDVDMVVLPGGLPGADNLRNDVRVRDFIQKMDKARKYVCAICAAPMVLHAAGVIRDRAITSHPGVREVLAEHKYKEDRVVVAGSMVTSRGPGTALEFSLELVKLLKSPDTADAVAAMMLARR
jgi:4-methyl-5(b-hydroxyethyl)-thiazole monophosphate biosynthesis